MGAMAEITLREWRASDAPSIAAIRAEPHLRRWSSMGDDVAGWIERQRAGARGPSRAICVAGEDRALGKIALRMPGHASEATSCAAIAAADAPVGELSYWVLPEARGRGLAGAAVREMVSWAAAHTDLRSVVLDVEATNAASRRLAVALGAQRRAPTRRERDRLGESRELIVFVLAVVR